MNLLESRAAIEAAIKGRRHPHYARMVETAQWTRRMTTGEDHEEWVRSIRPSESEHERDERWRTYKPATKAPVGVVRTMHSKIYRVDGIRFPIEHTDEGKKAAIEKVLQQFYGRQGVEEYIYARQEFYEFHDPNAWLIVSREDRRDQNAMIIPNAVYSYPIEVSAEQAIDYRTENGVPVFLTRLTSSKEGKEVIERFTLFAEGIQVDYQEYIEIVPDYNLALVEVEDQAKKVRSFAVSAYETGSEEFPGIKWGGYHTSGVVDSSVRVSPIDPASGILDQLVSDQSKLCLAIDKHMFPKVYAYDHPCDYSSEIGTCLNGKLNGVDGTKCPACNGSGSKLHKSEQQFIRIAIPPYGEARDLPRLSDLLYSVPTDIATIDAMGQRVERHIVATPFAVFSTQVTERPTNPATATENLLEMENVNNRVRAMATNCSLIVEKAARLTAQYLNFAEGFSVGHAFPENLRLESLTDLIKSLSSAREAGAVQDVVFSIQCELAEKVSADNPDLIANMKAFEVHRPWRSLDPSLIGTIIYDRAKDDPDRVLYENFDRVKTEVSQAYPNFSVLNYAAQRERILSQLALIANDIKYVEAPTLPQINLDDDLE